MATTTRIKIQSHQRLLAGCAAEDSRAPGSGSSTELKWPIRSLLSKKAKLRVSPPGQDGRGCTSLHPRPTLRAYRKNQPVHILDGFWEKMVTKSLFCGGWL